MKSPTLMLEKRHSTDGGTPEAARSVALGGDVIGNPHSLLVDTAYDEYCRLEEEGVPVDPDSFCALYPAVHSSLARMLEAHHFLKRRLPQEEPQWPGAGDTWSGFELRRELGSGAFAKVFLAAEPKMGGRSVALKLSKRGDHEAATLGPLDHPGVVAAHSVHHAHGLWGVCMPYRGSATLVQLIDRLRTLRQENKKPRGQDILDACADPCDPAGAPARHNPALGDASFPEAFRWFALQMIEALAFVHDQGIQHRDIKPSNILLQPDGRPLLLDFNLSAGTQGAQAVLGGTPLYMSPEQLKAMVDGKAGDLDQRCDLFSLGVVLYELAAGKHPFGPVSLKRPPEETRDWLLERQPQGFEPLRKACPDLPADIASVIESCLQLDPVRRPQSAAEMAARLRPRPSLPRRLAAALLRHPKLVLGLFGLFVAAAVAWGLSRPRPEGPLSAYERACQEFEAGNFNDAIFNLNQTLGREPDHVEARFLRGRAYLKNNDKNLAIADFEEMAKESDDGRAAAGIGFGMHLLKQPAGAKLHYEKAREQGWRTAGLLNNLAVIYLTNGKTWNLAEDALLEALKLDPNRQAPHYNVAILCMNRSMLSKPNVDRDVVLKGLHHIDRALALGDPAAEILEYGAELCMLASRFDRKYIVQGVRYLEDAVKLGLPLEKVRSRFEAFRGDGDFESLCAQPDHDRIAAPAIRYLDPWEGRAD